MKTGLFFLFLILFDSSIQVQSNIQSFHSTKLVLDTLNQFKGLNILEFVRSSDLFSILENTANLIKSNPKLTSQLSKITDIFSQSQSNRKCAEKKIESQSYLDVSSQSIGLSVQNGSCRFLQFNNFQFPVQPTGTQRVATLSECIGNTTADSNALGYSFTQPNTCLVFTAIGTDANHNSGICVQRNGCDGKSTESDCVWMRIQNSKLNSYLTSFQPASVSSVKTEKSCQVSCEDDTTCVGYSWSKTTLECSFFFAPSSLSGGSSIGFCMKELYLSKVPSDCWVGDKTCKNKPEVTIPKNWATDLTYYLSFKDVKGSISTITTNTTAATIEKLDFLSQSGQYTLHVSSSSSSCPLTSEPFLVQNEAEHTFWVWQPHFPVITKSPHFLIVRLENKCYFVLGVLVLACLLGITFLSNAIRLLMKKKTKAVGIGFFILIAIIGVFIWDFIQATIYWNCGEFVKQIV
eukprot:c15654_g1_i1.p1 GENE.c15654_g1_i1~~c15654_g1_i1.p1  ORF type:complete len:473 (-),score=129.14 c15654_g1_i1:71-1456(-)